MPRIEGLKQNTAEWLIHRIGMVTASRVADALDFNANGKESAKRKKYRADIVSEIILGEATEHKVTPAMEAGLEYENVAVDAYCNRMDIEVASGGFWVHDRIDRFGASPDRLIGDDGLLEVKCPLVGNHLEYRLAGVVPEAYRWQMWAQMACTGRKWCDFVSYGYHPHLPPGMRLFIRRFHWDEVKIAEMESGVELFLDEVLATLQRHAQSDPSELTEVLARSVEALP